MHYIASVELHRLRNDDKFFLNIPSTPGNILSYNRYLTLAHNQGMYKQYKLISIGDLYTDKFRKEALKISELLEKK